MANTRRINEGTLFPSHTSPIPRQQWADGARDGDTFAVIQPSALFITDWEPKPTAKPREEVALG